MSQNVALQEDFVTTQDLASSNTGSNEAVRTQRVIAFLVVVLPLLGLLLSIYLAMRNGVSAFAVWSFVVGYTLGMLGITLGFHRFFAHRSFETSRPMQIFLCILGSMSAQGPLFFWVATHRRHHANSDRPGDPHSPQLHGGWLKGLFWGHIGWMFSKDLTNWGKYVPDLMRNRGLFRLHRLYPVWLLLGLIIPAVLGWLIVGSAYGALEGLLYGGLVRIFFVNHALWAVGSISHMFGGRPLQSKTRDHSANNFWVAVAAFGEGNQNNHHAYPRSARHGLEWWQPDFTFQVIRFLSAIGLIKNVAVPPRHEILAQYALTRKLKE